LKTELFPFVFARQAGAPSNILTKFQAPILAVTSMRIITLQAYLQDIQSEINSELYKKISASTDRKIQNILLNMKRDVFNGRSVERHFTHIFLQNMSDLLKLLNAYQKAIADIQRQTAELEGFFNNSVRNAVQELRNESQQFYLKNGIAFSSQDTFENLAAFQADKYGEIRKDEINISMTLLKYLTRSVTKTSPFSTFNNIFTLRITNGIGSSAGKITKQSVLCIHNIVYSLFKKTMLSLPEMHGSFHLYVNPTLQLGSAKLHYFQNLDNQESFCTAEASPLLSHVIDFVNKKTHISHNELVNEVVNMTSEQPVKVNAYIEQLLNTSILLPRFQCNPKEADWPLQLAKLLREKHISNTKSGSRLLEMLEDLLDTQDHIERSCSADERQAAKVAALTGLRNGMCNLAWQDDNDRLGKHFDKLRVDNLFFEDKTIDHAESFDLGPFSDKFKSIALLHVTLKSCGYKSQIRTKLGSMLREASDKGQMPLLDFYKDVYLSSPETDPFGTDYQLNLVRAFHPFFKSIDSQKGQDQIVLHPKVAMDKKSGSFDLFAQVVDAAGGKILIINTILSEATTNISRFIGLCPDNRLPGQIRQRIEEQYPENIVAELLDASIHNVNNFPYLTGHVIDASLSVHENRVNIRLNDLFICTDANGEIVLKTSEGRRVIPIDFSMESISRRSSLFRFVDLFSDANSEGISGLIGMYESTIVLEHDFDQRPTVIVPRLCLNCGTVLSRKKWLTDAGFLMNTLFPNASEAIQFNVAQKWRIESGIPTRVFVRTGWGNHPSKPQYIDFEAPILFMLFKSIVKKASGRIEISEALPEPVDVSEYIFTITYSHC
jgi:hypothetical protein